MSLGATQRRGVFLSSRFNLIEMQFSYIHLNARALLIGAISAALVLLAGDSKIDDSYIYARYIANALAGHGLVFNPGEPVNALTSPLYAYLLLGTSWALAGHVLLAQKMLSFVGMAGASLLAESRVKYAGLMVVTSGYFFGLVGMESAWFVLLLIATILAYEGGKLDAVPVLLVLTCLTRFDGGALLLVIGWDMVRKRAFPSWQAFAMAVAIALAWAAFNCYYYGHILPDSIGAKVGQGSSGYWGGFLSSGLGSLWPAFRKIGLLPLVAIPVLTVVCLRNVRSEFNGLSAPALGIMLAFYIGFNVPGYAWYFAPFIFFGLMFAVQGLESLMPLRRWMLLAPALQLCAAVAYLGIPKAPHPYLEVGPWLAANTPPGARVATCEIGMLGWTSRREIIDILGLTTPKNAAHVSHRDLTSWLAEDSPDYVIAHDPAWWCEKAASGRTVFRAGNVTVLALH